MKRSIHLLNFFLFAFLMGTLSAQNSTLNGQAVQMDMNALTWIAADDDNQFAMVTLTPGMMGGYEDLIINRYDKNTQKLEVHTVDDDLDARFAYMHDDLICVLKQDINKKTKSVEYLQGSFFKDITQVKKMNFTPLYSVSLNENKLYSYKIDFSPDKSKFAILTLLAPKSAKESRHIADVAVFSTNGELLWHQQQNADWHVNRDIPFYLSNSGTVYIAEFGCLDNARYQREDSLYISVYNAQGIENTKESLGNHAKYYCGKCLLKDNRLVITGIACPNGRNSNQLTTFFVSEDGSVEQVTTEVELPTVPEGIVYDAKEFYGAPDAFVPYISQVCELKNGKLFLVGEYIKRGEVGTSITLGGMAGFSSDIIYGYYSRNLFCTTLSPDGEELETHTYPRATITVELWPNKVNNNPPYVFEHDDDIYLLYNENKANFQATQPQRWTFLYNNMADKCCVVLSKIENGDQLSNKVLYTAQAFPYPQQPALTSNFEFFSKVLTIDENAVYYLLKHDKEFRIEKISW
ncbi:MAG: hypothetical protein MJZ57_05575 [Bacteroidales bacterium]|nr:hypothetical protein [Bacteroidales bacterium]